MNTCEIPQNSPTSPKKNTISWKVNFCPVFPGNSSTGGLRISPSLFFVCAVFDRKNYTKGKDLEDICLDLGWLGWRKKGLGGTGELERCEVRSANGHAIWTVQFTRINQMSPCFSSFSMSCSISFLQRRFQGNISSLKENSELSPENHMVGRWDRWLSDACQPRLRQESEARVTVPSMPSCAFQRPPGVRQGKGGPIKIAAGAKLRLGCYNFLECWGQPTRKQASFLSIFRGHQIT